MTLSKKRLNFCPVAFIATQNYRQQEFCCCGLMFVALHDGIICLTESTDLHKVISFIISHCLCLEPFAELAYDEEDAVGAVEHDDEAEVQV